MVAAVDRGVTGMQGAPLTSAQYAEHVVLPTLQEFMAERANLRRAMLACIATYHLMDYVAADLIRASGSPVTQKRRAGQAQIVRDRVAARCKPALNVVQGLCNGTKHADPGSTEQVPQFVWDLTHWDSARWDAPGLAVEHEGAKLFIDSCAQSLIVALRAEFPDQLDVIDVSSFDATFRPE